MTTFFKWTDHHLLSPYEQYDYIDDILAGKWLEPVDVDKTQLCGVGYHVLRRGDLLKSYDTYAPYSCDLGDWDNCGGLLWQVQIRDEFRYETPETWTARRTTDKSVVPSFRFVRLAGFLPYAYLDAEMFEGNPAPDSNWTGKEVLTHLMSGEMVEHGLVMIRKLHRLEPTTDGKWRRF